MGGGGGGNVWGGVLGCGCVGGVGGVGCERVGGCALWIMPLLDFRPCWLDCWGQLMGGLVRKNKKCKREGKTNQKRNNRRLGSSGAVVRKRNEEIINITINNKLAY